MTFAGGGGHVAARKVIAEGRRNAGFARVSCSRAFDLICPVLREALRLLSGGAFFADGGASHRRCGISRTLLCDMPQPAGWDLIAY